VLYGLRRSEVLALRWDDLATGSNTLRIDESLVATSTGAGWSNAKNERSRRVMPIDFDTMRLFARRRAEQAAERLAAGAAWEDNDLSIATRLGGLVMPRSYDRALAILVDKAGLPRLTSHGLRHTAATHMVNGASDVGEPRAIADSWDTAPRCSWTPTRTPSPTARQPSSIASGAAVVARPSRADGIGRTAKHALPCLLPPRSTSVDLAESAAECSAIAGRWRCGGVPPGR
jgi:hypothetical protein